MLKVQWLCLLQKVAFGFSLIVVCVNIRVCLPLFPVTVCWRVFHLASLWTLLQRSTLMCKPWVSYCITHQCCWKELSSSGSLPQSSCQWWLAEICNHFAVWDCKLHQCKAQQPTWCCWDALSKWGTTICNQTIWVAQCSHFWFKNIIIIHLFS